MADYERYGLRYEGPAVQNFRKNISIGGDREQGQITGSPDNMDRYLKSLSRQEDHPANSQNYKQRDGSDF